MISFAGRRLAVLATPPHTFGAEGGTRTRALDVGNVASWPLDDFRPHKIMERAARVELASSGWRPEAPAAIPCSLLAGDEGLEPSSLDLEASVLAAGRISRKLMAELTGVEPVPADRQSAILPIDHSSGSLSWIRTTISAFRAQRPAIGRRGNFELSKNWLPGSDSNARTGFKSRVLPLDDAASRFQRYCFHAPDTQHR